MWRGRLYGFANDSARARADFRKALELDPDHLDARMYLALSVAQELPEEAVAHFHRLCQQYPDNKVARFSLASTRRALGQLEEARQVLDEMLASNPNDVSVLIERGYIALDTQRVEDAERWLRRAVELAPSDARSHLALSCCLRVAGKETEAKHYQDRFQQLEAEQTSRREETIRQIKADEKPKKNELSRKWKAAAEE